MGKKRFIEKNEGQQFHLLHRSQRDEAHANEEKPSNFVLYPSSSNSVKTSNQTNSIFTTNLTDHIGPLGFKNDGYDYSQHIKQIGKIPQNLIVYCYMLYRGR